MHRVGEHGARAQAPGSVVDVDVIGNPHRARIAQELVDALARRFRAAGGCFVVLENKSRYPRSSFYNTGYHLNEEAQILHSQSVGRSLVDILHRQEC